MTPTSMGPRVMAANSSSEFEAAATTGRPRSLRSASAKSRVWMRVLSDQTRLSKSEPRSSSDGIEPPDHLGADHLVTGHRSSEPGGGKLENAPCVKTLVSGGRGRKLDTKPAKILLLLKMYHQAYEPASQRLATYAKKCTGGSYLLLQFTGFTTIHRIGSLPLLDIALGHAGAFMN